MVKKKDIQLVQCEKDIVDMKAALPAGVRNPYEELGLLTEEDFRRTFLVLIRKIGDLEARIKELEK